MVRDGVSAAGVGGTLGAGLAWGRGPATARSVLRTLQSAALCAKAAGDVRCRVARRRSSPCRADSSGGPSNRFHNPGRAGGPAAGPHTRSGA